jgi:hypothetical protein
MVTRGSATGFKQFVKHQDLVQRTRTNRSFQQKRSRVGRKLAHRHRSGLAVLEEGQRCLIVDSVGAQTPDRRGRDRFRAGDHPHRTNVPGELGAARKMRHRITLDPDARYPKLLAFDQGRSGAAEWIEHNLPCGKAKAVQVGPHQVGRKREHKTVPFVNRAVF